MKSNKLKTGSIISIVFNALGTALYVMLSLILIVTVGLAKGFGGNEANMVGLDKVMHISMFLVPVCLMALIFAIFVLIQFKNNGLSIKKFAVLLIVLLAIKIVLNIINIVLTLDLISIIFAFVALIDIICIFLFVLGFKNKKSETTKNIQEKIS